MGLVLCRPCAQFQQDRAVQNSNSGIVSQRLADGNQSMHSTASPTATKVPVQLSPTLLPDKELENDEESNHPADQPTLSIPDSFDDTEWLITPASDIAWDKARQAYNQWKQEPLSLSTRPLTMPARASAAVTRQGGSAGSNLTLSTATTTDGAGSTEEDDANDGG